MRLLPRSADSPLALRATWIVTQALGRISPRLAARPAWRLWFTPWRLPQSSRSRERERRWLRGSEELEQAWAGGLLRGFAVGTGPVVLLVHGWGGWASRLGAYADPLVRAGFRVVAVDLPAHGRSAGRFTNLYEIVEALRTVADEVGPVHAVVTHSMGGLAALVAVERGLDVRGLVLLAPPVRMDRVRERFAEVFRLPPGVATGLVRSIDRRFGSGVWGEFDGTRIAAAASAGHPPTLVLHDPEDPDAPFEDAVAVAESLPEAELIPVPDAGHHRILLSPTAIAETARFLASLEGNPPSTTSDGPDVEALPHPG